MKVKSQRIILSTMAMIAVGLLSILFINEGAAGQAPAAQKPQMSDQAFKNVQILKGIPVDEFMDTMGMFAASTGMNCTDCHTEESGGSWPKYADDTALKQRARMMMIMVNGINKSSFAGKRMVTCWTCHRGTRNPRVIPDLAIQYSDMPDTEPDELIPQTTGVLSVDQTIAKYLQAIGGAQKIAAVTSITGKGTYEGYDTNFAKVPYDVMAKAPDQRTTVAHTYDGDDTTAFDGHAGWRAAPETLKPEPLIELTGGDLDGAKLDAEIMFPAKLKQLLIDWRVGYPETIEAPREQGVTTPPVEEDANVIQGRLVQNGLPVKLYFDTKSGLLVRMIHYTDSPVGTVPTQVDYSDYRDVSGVKLPFKWVVTWTDGRSSIEMSELHTNTAVDASKFAKPTPVPPKPAGN
jgi:photosynthetic reaction center cytochrome c subunit